MARNENNPVRLRRAAQRRVSRELKTGTFKPSPIGARSRKLTQESIARFHPEDRDLVRGVEEEGWLVKDGEPVENKDRRKTGRLTYIVEFANDLIDAGVPSDLIRIVWRGGRSFSIYASRES